MAFENYPNKVLGSMLYDQLFFHNRKISTHNEVNVLFLFRVLFSAWF